MRKRCDFVAKVKHEPGHDIWTPLPDFIGIYEISYHGKIRRTYKNGKYKIMYQTVDHNGVPTVQLTDLDGHRKEYRVHVLMAKTFLPPKPHPQMVLYHRNEIKKDNVIGNIDWISRSKLGKKTGGNSRRKPVVKKDKIGEIIEFYPSARDAARNNFMSYQTVIDRCNGKCKSIFAPDGYKYEWDDVEEA